LSRRDCGNLEAEAAQGIRRTFQRRSRRDCGNLEAAKAWASSRWNGRAAVAATAAILRRHRGQTGLQPALRRSRRDCGNLEAVRGHDAPQRPAQSRSRRDCGNLEAANCVNNGVAWFSAAVAATAAILRRSRPTPWQAPDSRRSRRDCGNLEAVWLTNWKRKRARPQSPRLRQS